MKTQGTQAVKNEERAKIDEAGNVQDEDPAHHIDPPPERFVEVSANLTDREGRWSRGHADARPQYLDSHCWLDLVTACKNVFVLYEQSTHETWEDLCRDVCDRHGQWLSYYIKDDRQAVFEIVVTNVLVKANKLQQSKPQDKDQIGEH